MATLVLNTSTDRTSQSTRGSKFYELSNHLGNVLATVSDMKLGYVTSLGQTTAEGYQAQVQSASDYFPFGWAMSGRQYSAGECRFGFNGMEKNPEQEGSYTTFYRQLDTRIGRWTGVDPVERADQTPYNSMDNNPIRLTDPNGDCPICPFLAAAGRNAAINVGVQGTIHVGFDLYSKGWDDFSMSESLGKIDVGDAMIFSGGMGGVRMAAIKIATASAIDLNANGEVSTVITDPVEYLAGTNTSVEQKSLANAGIDLALNTVVARATPTIKGKVEDITYSGVRRTQAKLDALTPKLNAKGLMGRNGRVIPYSEIDPLVRHSNRSLYFHGQRYGNILDDRLEMAYSWNKSLNQGASVTMGMASAAGKRSSKNAVTQLVKPITVRPNTSRNPNRNQRTRTPEPSEAAPLPGQSTITL